MILRNTTADLARLEAGARKFRSAPYLVTVTGNLRPHCSVVNPDWDTATGRLIVAAPSKWGKSEEAGHWAVTLLWPPDDAGGYTLIIDGTAATFTSGSERRLAITPSRAVLHRPEGAARPGSPCGADCIEIIPPSPQTDVTE